MLVCTIQKLYFKIPFIVLFFYFFYLLGYDFFFLAESIELFKLELIELRVYKNDPSLFYYFFTYY
jgi:hypothetical protein